MLSCYQLIGPICSSNTVVMKQTPVLILYQIWAVRTQYVQTTDHNGSPLSVTQPWTTMRAAFHHKLLDGWIWEQLNSHFTDYGLGRGDCFPPFFSYHTADPRQRHPAHGDGKPMHQTGPISVEDDLSLNSTWPVLLNPANIHPSPDPQNVIFVLQNLNTSICIRVYWCHVSLIVQFYHSMLDMIFSQNAY